MGSKGCVLFPRRMTFKPGRYHHIAIPDKWESTSGYYDTQSVGEKDLYKYPSDLRSGTGLDIYLDISLQCQICIIYS
jgi:hypothetical protein